jgi:hypothetical protein
MTRYAPLWQQAGSYAASQDRILMQTLWPGGGVQGGAVSAVANTANVNVAAGFCAVVLQGGQGVALCRWDATEVVAITTPLPPSGQSRIDLVTVFVRDNALDGGANNDFIVTSVPGTAAASPVAPALPTNSFLLATLTIPGAQANLNSATISDLRRSLQSPVVLRAFTGPAAQVSPGATYTVIVGSNQGGFGNIPTVAGRLYRITAFVRGQQQTSTSAANAALFQDGVNVGQIAQANPISANNWMSGSGVFLFNGDGNAHYWQIQGQTGTATMNFPANSGTLIVEDLGPVPA